jgi:hypothetical protein
LCLKSQHFSVLIWTTLMFPKLTLAIHSQFMTFSSVFATTSNNNDDISKEHQSEDSITDEESTDNNDLSSDTQSEQNNAC